MVSGAELELSVFTELAIIGIGVVYIVFRSIGKYYGAEMSAKWTKCSPEICKYLGITLLPQAGVALGMYDYETLIAQQETTVFDPKMDEQERQERLAGWKHALDVVLRY